MAVKRTKPVSWSERSFFQSQALGYPWPPTCSPIVFVLVTVLFAILPWLYEPVDGLASSIGMPLLSIVFGVLTGYGIAFVDYKTPAMVSVDRNGFCRMDSMLMFAFPILALFQYRSHTWQWRQISRAKIEPFSDDRLQSIITLYNRKNEPLGCVGIPASVEMDAVKAFCHDNNCPLETPAAQE